MESIGIVAPQTMHFAEPLRLQSGSVLGNYQLVVETYGELNAARSNAVLVCHALNASHHVAGVYADDPRSTGWWDNMVGPGKPLDTNRFFVIGVNNLGSCFGSTGPMSVDPSSGKPYGASFPVVTVEDCARAGARRGCIRHRALRRGDGRQPRRDAGARVEPDVSGARRALHRHRVDAEAVRAEHRVQRGRALGDPVRSRFPRRRLLRARREAEARPARRADDRPHHVPVRRRHGREFGRAARADGALDAYNFSFDVEFEVESYLRYQGDKFADYFDANTYLLITRALDYFDPAKAFDGNLTAALAHTQAKYLIASFDRLAFRAGRSREIVKALLDNKRTVSYAEIDAPHGHDAFLLDDARYHNLIRAYYERIANEVGA